MIDQEKFPVSRPTPRRTTGERSGGRSERVVRDILAAAFEELALSGYAGFRMEEVATRAGVNKTTLYRRWPGKAELVTAAFQSRPLAERPLPDTGSLEQDLVESLLALWEDAASPSSQSVLKIFFSELNDPAVRTIGMNARQQELCRLHTLMTKAQSRGELPASAPIVLVAELLHDAVTVQLRLLRAPSRETVSCFVQVALRGMLPRGPEDGGGSDLL